MKSTLSTGIRVFSPGKILCPFPAAAHQFDHGFVAHRLCNWEVPRETGKTSEGTFKGVRRLGEGGDPSRALC